MITLVLTAALFTQTIPNVEQIDLYFVGSQEQFAWEVAQNKRSPNKMIPKHMAGFFLELACNEWRVRDNASKELYKYCRANPIEERWLFWGRHSTDMEVAYRCDKIISRLHPCDSCTGDGISRSNSFYECWQCKGLGTLWGLHPWD
jgi:hypothetical protein